MFVVKVWIYSRITHLLTLARFPVPNKLVFIRNIYTNVKVPISKIKLNFNLDAFDSSIF